jgi:CubicO group peptidase (beta-lactamase class C family)
MAHYKVPGASIAVIEGGRVAWTRGVGVKEAAKSDPVTPATLFQAASISKPVTATAMLRLVERGKLDLDADVNRYLTSWKVPENEHTAKEKVTLRRLASHTAGLTVHGFPGYAPNEPRPTLIQILNGEPPANTEPVRVDMVPGSTMRYSGGGTVVMQQLLTDVTGKPFPALMQELVLGPAGMAQSTFEQPLPAGRAGEAARAHDDSGVVPGGWHVYPEMAPAGLWTTPTDLAKWAILIADAKAGRGTTLISQATATQMLTAQGGEAGLGPFVGGTGRDFQFGHGGVNEGFQSELVMYPERGTGAVIMLNGVTSPLLMRELLLALAAEYGWPDFEPTRVNVVTLSPAAIAGLVGEYLLRVGPGIPAEVRQESGKLTLHAPQIPVEELLPESDTSFVTSTMGWRVTFTRDASGRATGLTVLRENGMRVEGTRKK